LFLKKVELGNDKKMGRKGKWFSSVKKALSPDSKEKKDQVFRRMWFLILNCRLF
jgi:hypothetical protein